MKYTCTRFHVIPLNKVDSSKLSSPYFQENRTIKIFLYDNRDALKRTHEIPTSSGTTKAHNHWGICLPTDRFHHRIQR